MAWRIEWDDAAVKELRSLDRQAQRTILRYLRERIAGTEDPRRSGRQLTRELAGLWRYRIGAYRVVCSIEDERVVVLVLRVGHRKQIYRK